MDSKKIRKSQLTMTTLIIAMIAIIFIFITMFQFFSTKLDEANITVDDKYNDSYTNILENQEDLQTNIDDITDASKNIKEADDFFNVALNGFKVLGSTLLLLLNFLTTPFDILSSILVPLDFVPQYQKTLFVMGITAVVVFLVLANLKGEPRT